MIDGYLAELELDLERESATERNTTGPEPNIAESSSDVAGAAHNLNVVTADGSSPEHNGSGHPLDDPDGTTGPSASSATRKRPAKDDGDDVDQREGLPDGKRTKRCSGSLPRPCAVRRPTSWK